MLDKLKVINKNQVIVLVIALMLISVGYLNFTSVNKESESEIKEASTNSIEYAGIGDAKLVSSSNVEGQQEIGEALFKNEENSQNNIDNEISTTNTNVSANTNTNTIGIADTKTNISITTSSKEIDEYFSNSKLTRQTMYSQMLETYQKILENEQISQDQKSIAQTEIKKINDIKNKIMICENLIKVKDIEDVIIFVNDSSVSVIAKAKELKQEQIAQIQNIIQREMQVDISNIHISNKY